MSENNSEILQKKMDRRAILRTMAGGLVTGVLVGAGKRFLHSEKGETQSSEVPGKTEPVRKEFSPSKLAESSLSPQELDLIILGQLLVSEIGKHRPEIEELEVKITKLETLAFKAGDIGNNIRSSLMDLGENNKIGVYNAGDPIIPTASVEINYLQDSQKHEEIWLIVEAEPNKEENKFVFLSKDE